MVETVPGAGSAEPLTDQSGGRTIQEPTGDLLGRCRLAEQEPLDVIATVFGQHPQLGGALDPFGDDF